LENDHFYLEMAQKGGVAKGTGNGTTKSCLSAP
jgi:hypothetical protein